MISSSIKISLISILILFLLNSHTLKAKEITNTESKITSNWAVIVSTSRFWFNYRHTANALSIYYLVKNLGIPDSQIILMLADDYACNPRNKYPGTIFNNLDHKINLYGENIEVDYRGLDVSVENFMRVLTGRHKEEEPRNKRLFTDSGSNILIYMTGHGGDEFLKFQDTEEITSYELANAIEEMHQNKRYNEIFVMVDTCQAATLFQRIYSPNVIVVGSSRYHENSYSSNSDSDIGISEVDQFTLASLNFLDKITPGSNEKLISLFQSYKHAPINSNPYWEAFQFQRDLNNVLITDFFGSSSRSVLYPKPHFEFKPILENILKEKKEDKIILFEEEKETISIQKQNQENLENQKIISFLLTIILIVFIGSFIEKKVWKEIPK
ncbi:gpi-anchor transamidase [Anaeramoeba ignava]|uniref:Gpi-anchor transamidase n=1 Tax=Anaeramoeba ignava TaxID=1746090 RepID=A0A9Q0LVF3_ANAIG|nr:gpi-anchor transamidase [Anaeramoeba ignava]